MFCDKTGTLTQNELIFKAFKIIGQESRDEESVTTTAKDEMYRSTENLFRKETDFLSL